MGAYSPEFVEDCRHHWCHRRHCLPDQHTGAERGGRSRRARESRGRGFAVVATEVRSLAQRSAAAAKEIKGLISDSVAKVQSGTKLVDQAGRTMEEIVASIARVARIMTDIAEASREQSSGIEQVGNAITQMDEVTQQNAALVEQAAAAAESLEEQANALMQSVSVFQLENDRQPVETAAAGTTPPRRSNSRPAPALPHNEPVRLDPRMKVSGARGRATDQGQRRR